MNFEQDVKIDETQLEVEIASQPELSFAYGRAEVEAMCARDSAKQRMKILEAELCNEVRATPDLIPGGKTTEKALQDYVTTHERYKEAEEEYLALVKEYELIRIASADIRYNKMKALELLVKLSDMKYFEGPAKPKTQAQFAQATKEKRELRTATARSVGGVLKSREIRRRS